MLRCNILKWIWRLIHKLQNGASKGQGSGCRGRNNNTRCYFRRISPERPTRPLEKQKYWFEFFCSWREHISCLFWQRQIQIVFMGEAINKGKFVQATHYVVRLQSARFIVPIPPSFLRIFGPCQPTTVVFFLFSFFFVFFFVSSLFVLSLHKHLLIWRWSLFSFWCSFLAWRHQFQIWTSHLFQTSHLHIWYQSGFGIFFDLEFPIPSYLFSQTTVSTW